jgi:hypothetical protein
MDPSNQKPTNTKEDHHDAPPSLENQDQPWKKWFASDELDTTAKYNTDEHHLGDLADTQASTNMG